MNNDGSYEIVRTFVYHNAVCIKTKCWNRRPIEWDWSSACNLYVLHTFNDLSISRLKIVSEMISNRVNSLEMIPIQIPYLINAGSMGAYICGIKRLIISTMPDSSSKFCFCYKCQYCFTYIYFLWLYQFCHNKDKVVITQR